MNIEEFVKWKDVGVDKLIISLVRLRKHNKTLAQFLFLKLLLFIPAFQESFGVPDMPIYPKRGKNKETLSTKLVKAILKCSERKAWDYARAFSLECEIEKFSNEYHKRLILAINSDAKTMKRKSVETVFCKDCSKLETKANPKPFCPYLGAFIIPELLSRPWQCDGYKEKRKEDSPRRKELERLKTIMEHCANVSLSPTGNLMLSKAKPHPSPS